MMSQVSGEGAAAVPYQHTQQGVGPQSGGKAPAMIKLCESKDGIAYEFLNQAVANSLTSPSPLEAGSITPISPRLYSDEDLLVQGFRRINLMGSSEELLEYKETGKYRRGGAECWVADAEIKTTRRSIKCIAKAYITTGGRPGERVKDLEDRRLALQKIGVRVPETYTVDRATLYQEYIEHELLTNNQLLSEKCKQEVAKTAALLDFHGYSTQKFLDDMRISADGDKAYYVDFGQDLGDVVMADGQVVKSKLSYQQLEMYFQSDKSFDAMKKAYNEKMYELNNP